MELETILNGGQVTVHYEVEHNEVDCYDAHSNREYTGYATDVTVESVLFNGIDISAVVSESDMTELEMACTIHYDEVEA